MRPDDRGGRRGGGGGRGEPDRRNICGSFPPQVRARPDQIKSERGGEWRQTNTRADRRPQPPPPQLSRCGLWSPLLGWLRAPPRPTCWLLHRSGVQSNENARWHTALSPFLSLSLCRHPGGPFQGHRRARPQYRENGPGLRRAKSPQVHRAASEGEEGEVGGGGAGWATLKGWDIYMRRAVRW